MKKFLKIFLFILLCIVLFVVSFFTGCAVRTNTLMTAPFRYVQTADDETVWYTVTDLDSDGAEDTRFDLYLPAKAEDRPYGMLLFLHGGGFTSGDKADGARVLPYYAAKGFVGVSANYTLATEPDAAFDLNRMLRELQTTVQKAVEACKVRGYRVTEMAAGGESAGGCLAMLLAYRDGDSLPIPVRFIFSQSGPATMDPVLWGFTDPVEQATFVSKMSGQPFTESDLGSEAYLDAMDSVSPTAWVKSGGVPSILAYGPKDNMVPPVLKEGLLEALEAEGIPYTYLEFPHSGHGLLHDPKMSDQYYRTIDAYLAKYMQETADLESEIR